MSFCGSVVSNDFPIFNSFDEHEITDFNDGLKNYIRTHFTPNPNQHVNINCTNQTCFEFKFINNTVSQMNMMKNPTGGSPFFKQRVNWKMKKFALVI